MRPDEALAFLKKGAAQIISEAELREKLALGRPLRVKLGVDPTTADIHLGHAVVLRKLRQFQDVGHQAVLIIGDFTGMIGDPSGRSATRPHLTHKEVMHNAQSYREQAFKILDPARTETVCNGDWFRSMSYEDVLRLNSRVTLQQMLQREDFRGRIDNQQAIHAHEIQYPIMQGWDSVMVRADVELGGTDQLFNILVGRGFQKEEGMPQQIVFLLPILEGLDGSKKMSKSLGNFVGVSEPPTDMFGKLMSISDKLMVRYYEVLLGRELRKGADPFEAKKQLAFEIVQTYHSAEVAQRTLTDWNARFSKKRLDEAELPAIPAMADGSVTAVTAAYAQAFALKKSRAEVSRLIKQGSVQIDGKKIVDPKSKISLRPGQILRLDKTH
ncbi:MAG: tyrosine--tRNA ligase, partial [Verrucomicrobia bacterium]